jgi:O-succinylbenzoic acid--CoA ligase
MNHVIHTGGKKVHPEEVEAAIRTTGLVQDIYVLGLADRHWGEVVSAAYVSAHAGVNPEMLQTALGDQLSRFKQPKYWLSLDQLPRNAQGKINRAEIVALLNQQRAHSTAVTTGSILQ